jgi:hypothetical protein
MVNTVLPYAGTSGWSGTETSEERAKTRDISGKTSDIQAYTLGSLYGRGPNGLTWKELSEQAGWHHGTSSGVLSVLHKVERIYRLKERRGGCRVYVYPDYLNGREHDMQGRKPKECPNCGHSL